MAKTKTKTKTPTRKPPTLSEALVELADLARPLIPLTLYALNDLTREQVQRVRTVWLTLPPERRTQILVGLNEISEADYAVDFQFVAQTLGLRDPDPIVRRAAIDALWEPEDVSLLETFLRMILTDPDESVRAGAADGLSRFVLMEELGKLPRSYHGRAAAALFTLLDDPITAPEIRRRALEAISYASDERVSTLIRAAFDTPGPYWRASALFAMGRTADERWGPLVLAELDSPDPALRYEAARAAGEIELRTAVARLIALTADRDREVQEAALWSLGTIGGDKARRHLQRLTDSEDPALAEAAEEALNQALMFSDNGLTLLELNEDEEALGLSADADDDGLDELLEVTGFAPSADDDDDDDEDDDGDDDYGDDDYGDDDDGDDDYADDEDDDMGDGPD